MTKFFTLRNLLLLFISGAGCLKGWAQTKTTAIVNYDFNPGTSYATLVPSLAAGVSCLATSTETFATAAGAAAGLNAFTANSTAGNAIIMNNSGGMNARYYQFELGGSSLNDYFAYKVYFQGQSSATGATAVTLAYSTDGLAYTNFIPAGSPGNGSFSEISFDLSSINILNNQAGIYFRLLVSGASGGGTFRIDNFQVQAQTIPKYYRSITGGDWNNVATWESSADNVLWFSATAIPTSEDKVIIIQSGNTVIASTPTSLDETIINGTLQVLTGGTLDINDGAGNDIDILNNGVLQVVSANAYSAAIIPGTSLVNIATGGKITIGDGSGIVGAGYETFATSTVNIWNDAAVFEWSTPTDFVFSGSIYFPNATGVIPNFTITKVTGPVGGSSTVTLNGLLTVNTDFILSGNGLKILRDGITGTSQLTLNPSANGYTISSPAAIIGGTVSIILNQDLRLTTGVTIPAGSSVNISGTSPNNIAKGTGGIFLVNGSADMNSTNILNTSGNITVNGTLKTSNANGLYGTGATIINGPVILNANSTIEYNANGPQNVQGATLPSYYNVTFSGSGTKTLVSNNNPAGTITVSGLAIFDAGNSAFGITGTNLTMTGSSGYITGGGTTKPDAQGTYSLASGTTIEFALNSATTIRLGTLPINYAHIIVSGTNVSNASAVTGITFQNGGSFTVKTGATFKLDNTSGFTGGTSTAVISTNNPAIILEGGSTIEYSGTPSQTITNQLAYENLTIAGSGIKTAPPGILVIRGNLIKSGTNTFVHNGGTVLLSGPGTQTFAGLVYNNLILTNNTKNTSGNSIIIDSIKVSAGTTLSISAADTITLRSGATKTARMAKVDGSIAYNLTGTFVVERYISAKAAWRFLSTATNSSQSIKEAWQEGALNSSSDPIPGFGTQITSNRASWLSDGFDVFSAGGPSMKTYNAVTDNYNGITTTLASFDNSLGGYMTFVRGNRTAITFGSPVSSTVLRSAGSLFTGNQPGINVISGKVIPVNNPYASPLDLRRISTSFNVFYYVWDPHLGGTHGLGAFQTLSWNGVDYDVVPGNSGSYGATNNFIESGQAFFVSTFGADTTLQLNEDAKSDAVFTISPFFTTVVAPGQLRTNLYEVMPGGSILLEDGVLNNFGNYNNGIDGLDARKLFNSSVNLSIKTAGKLLVIERKQAIMEQDTIFLNLTGVRVQQYQFRFDADNLNKDIEGFLEDSYLHKRTPVNLTGSTVVNFNIVNVAGSYAPDRFRIVFAPAVILPVTFTSVKAYPGDKSIIVEWKVDNEKDINQYVVEKSINGNQFSMIAIQPPTANTGRPSIYVTTDIRPSDGYNYYRVKSVDINGKTAYSNVIKVLMRDITRTIIISPNPLADGIIYLQFINQPGGKYEIRLFNKLGQVILSRQITHAEGSSTEIIKWEGHQDHGMYQLEVTKPGGEVTNITMLY